MSEDSPSPSATPEPGNTEEAPPASAATVTPASTKRGWIRPVVSTLVVVAALVVGGIGGFFFGTASDRFADHGPGWGDWSLEFDRWGDLADLNDFRPGWRDGFGGPGPHHGDQGTAPQDDSPASEPEPSETPGT